MGEKRSGETWAVVIGAGPAGIFTAQDLAERGVRVILLNRDMKPGGLAEYGIYHSKHRIKAALRTQFHKILKLDQISYFGNVTIAEDGDLMLDQLRDMGFGAIVVAVGAQGTKWLGLPGEELRGVYHAKDVIYYYNGLPPYSERQFDIGRRVALIGVGNVMADIAHWLVRDMEVDEVVAVARRGPAEVTFTRQELEYFAANLDIAALKQEIARVSVRMEAVGQDPEAARDFILEALSRAVPPTSDTRVRFRFLSSPSRMLEGTVGDASGHVAGLEVEDTELELDASGQTKAKRLGTTAVLDVDTVIFCIGDRVSDRFGLPVQWSSFVKHPAPSYPVDGISYEAYDPEAGMAVGGVFVVGWARTASKGQVALARKDARGCAEAVAAYLADHVPAGPSEEAFASLLAHLEQLDKPIITTEDALRLAQIEAQEAEARNDPGFRFTSNEEMLAALQ
jgi:ferredoxin/flavodoxin---NADP+ reductase